MFSGRRGKKGTRNPDRPDSISSLQFNSSEDLVLRPLGRSNPTTNLSSTTSASASASASAAADPSSEDESFVHVRALPTSHSTADAPPAPDSPDPDTEHALGSPRSSIADEMPSNSIPRRPASSAGLTPFLLGGQPLPASYGSVSPSPTQDMSTDSDPDSDESAPLRLVRGDGRSSTKRKSRSASGSKLSHAVDLDSAVLVTGMEDRFAVPDASMAATVLEDAKATYDKTGDRADGSYQTTVCDEEYGDGGGGAGEGGDDEHEHLDNSPYDVVRASVSPLDNTSLSINTPRMWTLSVLFSILGSSTNLFFSLRYPSVAITPVIALLLVHPLGHAWDMLLKRQGDPIDEYVDGVRRGRLSDATDAAGPRHLHLPRTRRHRLRLWLAQGRWNEKEHTCVYVSSNIAFGFAFATDVIVEQHKFYGQEVSIVYQLLLTISTQMLGYTFAGITRRFLVWPSGMIWPATLMSASMFSTLHKEENKPANGWTISRWRFFLVVWLSAFLFYFLPGLLFPALSYFNVLTWFAPDSVVVANLFGVVSGLGLFPATFDWAQVTYIGSPLLVPFWAAMNVVGGLVVVMWIAAPLAYYANVFSSAYLPMLSSSVFDNTGKVYDVGRILTPDFLFDRAAYEGYSRVFLPITYVLSYGVQFAGLAALLTHTFCWYGPDIWKTWKSAVRDAREGVGQPAYEPLSGSSEDLPATPTSTVLGEGLPRRASTSVEGMLGKEDVHSRLMKRYQDAPITWYLMTFASMLAIGIFLVEYYPIHLPWYGLLLALAICAIFFIPNGIIMAVTNQHSSIYLICQLVCGSVFPGRPIANMVFVTYGYISSAQGIKFASDLKLGHYMKVPPRILFVVQMVATLASSVTQIGVLNWMFANVSGLCTPEAVNGFTCPIARVHFNGSILWGVVGPAEFFGPGTMYRALVWFFLVGAVLPIPVWLYSRNRKGSPLRKVNFPVIFGTMGWIPPATGLNFSVWALVCFVFNYLVKRRAGAWWSKYTMTLSAALDSGLAFGIVVVFFGFIYPGVMRGFSWWGTEVYKQGCDWKACAWLKVPDGSRFGPDTW